MTLTVIVGLRRVGEQQHRRPLASVYSVMPSTDGALRDAGGQRGAGAPSDSDEQRRRAKTPGGAASGWRGMGVSWSGERGGAEYSDGRRRASDTGQRMRRSDAVRYEPDAEGGGIVGCRGPRSHELTFT